MEVSELRGIFLFTGLSDEQIERADRPRRRVPLRRRPGAVRAGRPCRLLVGAARRSGRAAPARRTRGVGRRDDGPSRCLGRRLPGVGRRRRLPGHRSGRGCRPDAPRPCRVARRARAHVVPLRHPHDRRLLPDGPEHGGDVAPAGGARRARARSPPDSPTSSTTRPRPRCGPSTRSRPRATSCWRRWCAWPSGRCPPSSSSRSSRCVARSIPPARPVDPLAVADREDALPVWLDAHGVDDGWRIAPALAAAGVDVAWCQRVADVLDRRPPRSRPRVDGGHAVTRRPAAGGQGVDRAGVGAGGRGEVVLPARPGVVAAHRRHRGHREHAGDARSQAQDRRDRGP